MNNKGQVLVLFIILIPVIFLCCLVVYEVGNLYFNKVKTIDVIKETIEFCLKNKDEEKINKLIDSNINYLDKAIFISDDEIRIKLSVEENIFGKEYIINYSYKGNIVDDKIIIEEG